MIKPGDIYIQQDGTIVAVNQVRTYSENNNPYIAHHSTYLDLTRIDNDEWHGTWEQGYFLEKYRPITKLEKLLAGM